MRKFMRPRTTPRAPSPPPAAHKSNGYSNGAALSDESAAPARCWSEPAGAALWEDAEFPAAAASLGERRLAQRTRWLRPHELCARPRFLGDTLPDAEPDEPDEPEPAPEPAEQFAARWRVSAGEAGDAALGCAAAALALTPRLLARVVPPQSFGAGYCGRFRFRFWVFGAWRDVAVDDRLPARGAALLGSRAALRDDFTLPLLEKAYAKLHGGYARLRGGCVARALQELSGGVVQSFAPPRQPRALLLQVLHAAAPRSTLLVASAARAAHGLLAAQAYCVQAVTRAPEALVLLRAPGGRGEWTGAWAHGAPQWRELAAAEREPLLRRADRPGLFWMPFAEFARAFSRLELVHVGPDDWLREPALHERRPWRAVLARRRWRRGVSAGGPPGAPTAHANPHFHLQVPRAAGPCHVVVSVTQAYGVGAAARALLGVGFAVYELPPGTTPRRAALPPLRELDVTHWSRAREVVTFFTLPAGQYLVVPHAHRAHAEAAFLLRVLTDHPCDVWEVNDDNAIIRDIASEFADEGRSLPAELQAAIARVVGPDPEAEVDAAQLRARLRRGARRVLPARASLELCRALVALRDPAVSGRVRARELAPLLARLALWRAALAAAGRCARLSAYRLRALLWACGVSASNKVLECLVLRFARGAALDAHACVLALARLHLAHERFRSLDTKLKCNPLSLEEMILMTIYS